MHLRTVTGAGGGPEKTLLNSHRFTDGKFDLRLVYLFPYGDSVFDLPQRARESGAQLVAFGERGPIDPKSIRQLYGEIQKFNPHLIHAHDYKSNLLAAALCPWFGIPAVTTLHGYVSFDRRLKLYYKIDRWVLRRMNRVMAVSRDLKDWAVSSGIPGDRCVLIENGIDTEQFRRRRSVLEAKLASGASSDIFLLGAVGRLMPEKGFDLLIRAVSSLRRELPRLRLRIAGEGPERSRLEALIGELDCAEQVELVGFRPEIADFLEACDAFVLSSRREAFPNAVLEAMAMEAPVIASRVAGVPELIADGETGLLVEPEDVAGIAAAVKKLIANKDLSAHLTTAARLLVETRFTFAERMQKEFAVYDDLLGHEVIQRP